jgi:hypothetical protein
VGSGPGDEKWSAPPRLTWCDEDSSSVLLESGVIWKERNHCIFDQEECSFAQIVQQIKDAFSAYRAVHPFN